MANNYNIKNFKPQWITNGADGDMIDYAETIGDVLHNEGLTTSQIRNVYSEVKRIQTRGYNEEINSFFLLRPKVAYMYGRNVKKDKNGNITSGKAIDTFKEYFFDKAIIHVNNAETYDNFCNLMEAVLAYHRFYGGK